MNKAEQGDAAPAAHADEDAHGDTSDQAQYEDEDVERHKYKSVRKMQDAAYDNFEDTVELKRETPKENKGVAKIETLKDEMIEEDKQQVGGNEIIEEEKDVDEMIEEDKDVDGMIAEADEMIDDTVTWELGNGKESKKQEAEEDDEIELSTTQNQSAYVYGQS